MAKILFIFASFLALTLAEEQVVNITPCEEYSSDVCTISEVRINPCNPNKNCVFKQGSDASMTVNFTPNFSASNLDFGLFWVNGGIYIPFPGLKSSNGCEYTTCPTQVGQAQSFSYSLRIGKKLSKGTFRFRWLLSNQGANNQACCFITTIKIK